jgi:hypothetical protein
MQTSLILKISEVRAGDEEEYYARFGAGKGVDVILHLLYSVSHNMLQENFDKWDKKKAQITFPLRHFYPLKVVK